MSQERWSPAFCLTSSFVLEAGHLSRQVVGATGERQSRTALIIARTADTLANKTLCTSYPNPYGLRPRGAESHQPLVSRPSPGVRVRPWRSARNLQWVHRA
jgi:hypothetical protein